MGHYAYALSLALGIPALSVVYYFVTFGPEVDRLFLTISTFLFSIFTGFFISRQASRFNRVRETVTAFDGKLSSFYRTSGHISQTLQEEAGAVIRAHYERIFKTGQWNIHFLEKSTTLSSLHALLDSHIKEDEVTKLSNQAIGALIKGLAACQAIRKQMIALYRERIPKDQWILICFFAAVLIMTVSTLPSIGFLLGSLLKAAFVASVLSVLFILYKLNELSYTEQIMGERSARDVLDISNGDR